MATGLLYVFYKLLSRRYNTNNKRNRASTLNDLPEKEANIMKKILAAIEEFLELYFASFSITAVR